MKCIAILSTLNAALLLIVTRFAACTGSIWVSFIEPRLLQTDTNGLYRRFSLHINSDQIYVNVFYVFEIWGSQAFPLNIYCSISIEPHCFCVCVYQWWPQTLLAICRNMGTWNVFIRGATRKVHQFYLIGPFPNPEIKALSPTECNTSGRCRNI